MSALRPVLTQYSLRSWRLLLLAGLFLSACTRLDLGATPAATVSAQTATPTAVSVPTSAPTQVPSATPESAVVVYVKDGDLMVWEETSGETHMLLDADDAIGVTMSDDGQVVAFLRRSIIGDLDSEWHEQSALWAVDRNGENSRELVSAEQLRLLLDASETDSTNFPQMAWIPRTHRLFYSGWTYLVQAEGESHAIPQGLFLVDADTLSQTVLVPAGNNLRFLPSPDGRQIALMSLTGLSFINPDGSGGRHDLLTYPATGEGAPLFPTGIWTADSRAFLITGFFEQYPGFGSDFAVWQVPVGGSLPEQLASIRRSDPRSVTFSPDGESVAFIQYTEERPVEIAGWFISPLIPGVGPLAIPPDVEVGYASLHWAPDGRAFTAVTTELCAGATQDSEVCETPLNFWGSVAAIRWMDSTRFLFLTRDPSVLFLGTLDPLGIFDATTVPIVAWPLEEWVGPHSFTAVNVSH